MLFWHLYLFVQTQAVVSKSYLFHTEQLNKQHEKITYHNNKGMPSHINNVICLAVPVGRG